MVGSIDSLGRGYVVGGPLRGVAWRSKVIGSAEGVVNLLLLLGTYRLVGVPLVTLVGIFLALSWGLADLGIWLRVPRLAGAVGAVATAACAALGSSER